MALIRWLRGYDKNSELVGEEALRRLPDYITPFVLRSLIPPNLDDPELLDCYPIKEPQLSILAKVAELSIDPAKYDYFVEAEECDHAC